MKPPLQLAGRFRCALCLGLTAGFAAAAAAQGPPCVRTISADVVALDQPLILNRLGASVADGMMFALAQDVVSNDPSDKTGALQPGKVTLRPGKRPRPLVLRMNVGDCLKVTFTNLLCPSAGAGAQTRYAGLHVNGLDLAPLPGSPGIDSDGSWVGKNPGSKSVKNPEPRGPSGSLVSPGGQITYVYYAKAEGTFLMYSAADSSGIELGGPRNTPSQPSQGLFGAVNVQPRWAEWYRSQVTREDLRAATLRMEANFAQAARAVIGAAAGQVQPVVGPTKPVNNRLLSLLPPRTPPPQPGPTVEARAAAVRSQVGTATTERFSLLSIIPDKHAEIVTDVLRDPEGRLYSIDGHALIDYDSVYPPGGPREGVPVLKMLRTIPGPRLFQPSLTPAQVEAARLGLVSANSYITQDLAGQFTAQGRTLSGDVQISDAEGRTAWLLTDPGKALYYVEQVGAGLVVSSASLQIIHSDLTAIITGPRANRFGYDQESPTFVNNPALPDRRQPYREFTILYHFLPATTQAFAQFNTPSTQTAFAAGLDQYAINYGAAAIGPEVIANRMGVGPMGRPDAVDLKFEEFFLSSWAVGDPAMLVDAPANGRKPNLQGPPAKPLFSVDVAPALVADLDRGTVDAGLRAKFAAAGFELSNAAIASAICGGNEWVVLDPVPGKPGTPPNRGRFPVVAGTETRGGVQVRVLNVFGGPLPTATVTGPATKALFPDDPSNVYHSNLRDHVKFRILHAGPGPSHVHHLHAHQWLHTPNDTESQYLDSQLIIPGSAYTLDIVYNGSGNRNMTVGDSIFHCHFYPHFAKGMWSLWRVHDVFEAGTRLGADGRAVQFVDKNDKPVYRVEQGGTTQFFGTPAPPAGAVALDPDTVDPAFNRALPDGEIESGTPIPAIVPLPSLAEPPIPPPVRLTDLAPYYPAGEGQGRRVYVEPRNADAIRQAKVDKTLPPEPEYDNPGYPFFIPGVAGHRPPHPPMDFGWKTDPKTGEAVYENNQKVPLDGGLPRHVVLGGQIVKEYQTRWDFTRDFIARDEHTNEPIAGKLSAMELPEKGTPVEKGAMEAHSHRTIPSFLPNGDPGNVTRNGLPALPGAPYAPPMADDYGNANYNTRRYQAAVIQTDVVQNKLGWHFPQQRFLTLWEDVAPTIAASRAPQPLFFRSNTDDTIQFWHTNLVPSYYQLDDFQVRTPTDVIGQHIHNVKFDVTSSDGGANGFNYEDGTFSPDEVRDRIDAINQTSNDGFAPGLLQFDDRSGFVDKGATPKPLTVVKVKDAYPPRNGAGSEAYGLFGKPPEGQTWDGAQTTIQLWDCDPLLSDSGAERTLRTIFTHDHLGPSTHQQVGLYAGLVVEPQNSLWYLPGGERMNSRLDGGPTNWEGYIVTSDIQKSYREFAIEFQDTQLAYTNTSLGKASNKIFTPIVDPATGKLTGPAAFDAVASAPANLAAYVAFLDRGQLPPEFPAIFLTNGIRLSPAASVQVLNPGAKWQIQEPTTAGALNSGAPYIVWTGNFISQPVGGGLPPQSFPHSLFVTTPKIEPGWADPNNALNAQGALQIANAQGTTVNLGAPGPQLVSDGGTGVYSMNYRNESILARVASPANTPLAPNNDLAYAFNSRTDRDNVLLNVQPTPGSPIDPSPSMPANNFKYPPPVAPLLMLGDNEPVPGVNEPGDPFTPLMRAYAGDRVHVRTLVGAHVQNHVFQIQGVNWNFEPDDASSGRKNAQAMGISEHFEMQFTLPSFVADHTKDSLPAFADYLVAPSSSISGLANGDWTLMRAFAAESGAEGTKSYLHPLPNNLVKDVGTQKAQVAPKIAQMTAKVRQITNQFAPLKAKGTDQVVGNLRYLNVTATTVGQAMPGQSLVFNSRLSSLSLKNMLLFVRTADLDANGRLKADAPREPLILRARAGDWIMVNLTNALPAGASTDPVLTMTTTFQNANANYPIQVDVATSRRAGLHPALVSFDVTQSNGVNLGFNPDVTVAPVDTSAHSRTFLWYAGDLIAETDRVREHPIEFGATNLVPAELMVQPQFGMVGALVVEPRDSDWVEDVGTHASALVTVPGHDSFREFVLVGQNVVANTNFPTASAAWGAFNFRTEPFAARNKLPANGTLGYAKAFSNEQIDPTDLAKGDPQTPIFRAAAGTPVRFRFVMPSTTTTLPTPFVFDIHGHGWQEEPFSPNGTRIEHNPRSQFFGAQQVAPYEAFNFVLDRAGGAFGVTGDFLYETYLQTGRLGTWGLLRVEAGVVTINEINQAGSQLTLSGRYQPSRANAGKAGKISVTEGSGPAVDATVGRDGETWTFTTHCDPRNPTTFAISSSLGGSTELALPLKVSP